MKYVWEDKLRIQGQITHAQVAVILDYDGTLTPIVATPEAANLSVSTKAILQKLTERKHTRICILSGRTLADIRERVGVANIDYAGMHGYESDIHAMQLPIAEKQIVMQDLGQILSALPSVFPGALFEDKTVSLALHYRMVSAENVSKLLRRVSDIVAPYVTKYGIVIKKGKKVLEVFVDDRWNKGVFVNMYLQKIRVGSSSCDAVIYIGDDATDEDAFVQLPNAITIRVGKKRSNAQYWVHSVSEVLTFLSWVNQIEG